MRSITYAQAVNEGIDLCMREDPRVFIIGEGVPDPKGIFGTTLGLREKYGKERVLDMPVAENGMTGICIGAALSGMKPILVHQRIDFSLLSFDQIANVAAKWFYMFGGKQTVPIVIRMIVGRGWGQGSQHSQSLQALYGHIPGLKVIMPVSPHDAKGLMIAAVADKNPVIFIEHRWLHNITGEVPERIYTEVIGKARIVTRGKDITIVGISYMTIESSHAAKILTKLGITAEIIDLRTISPIDIETIISSVKKTGKLIIADTGVKTFGVGAEIVARVSEEAPSYLKKPPVRVSSPFMPPPTSRVLAEKFFPNYKNILAASLKLFDFKPASIKKLLDRHIPHTDLPSDIPDKSFTGPF